MSQEKINIVSCRAFASGISLGFIFEHWREVVLQIRQVASTEKNLGIGQNQHQQAWLAQDGGC